MYIRFTKLSDGPGPSEALVGVQTVDGRHEEVVISQRVARAGSIDVGSPLAERDGNYLIELPREAMSGHWRVWIAKSEIADTPVAAE